MPVDAVLVQRALVAIAVASILQVLLLGCLAAAAFVAWRRARRAVDHQLAAFDARLDSLAHDVRAAALAVDRAADGTSHLVHDAGSMVRTVATAVAAPRTVFLAAATRIAGRALFRWRASRTAAAGAHRRGA